MESSGIPIVLAPDGLGPERNLFQGLRAEHELNGGGMVQLYL